jgi:decaprenylphospho-beta-D-erythro-pentofuranosid-2-ulose 2-reductase
MTNLPWNRAIVVGASSGIGAEIAEQLARGGCHVALVARRQAELCVVADRINERAGSTLATAHAHDVADIASVPALFSAIVAEMGGLDLIVYSAGAMPRIQPAEYDMDKDALMIQVNITGAVAWLNEAAHRFGQAKAGTIVGIGSVAGDRGRRGYPVYGASKAFLDTYLEGLRNRLGRFGVAVVTIKPGPVDTPMTRGAGKLPMMISAEDAAAQIIAAMRDRVPVAYVPAKWKLVMGVIKAIPSPIFRHLNI